ncbi:MAG: alpha/beta hydrolase family protein [Pseudomonadales bacterium]|nr:alpha/beta hydrolase family protein [Pseudomonadales bacterium]
MKKIIILSLLGCLNYNFSYASSHADDGEPADTQAAQVNSDETQSAASVSRVLPKPRSGLERDLALLLQDSLTEVVQLSALDQQFDLYYLEADAKKPVGSLLFFPDDRTHSNWPVTLAPLRVGLPRYNWQTAVITQPVAELAATPERTLYALATATEEKTGDDSATDDSIAQSATEDSDEPTSAVDVYVDAYAYSVSDNSTEYSLAEITMARATAASQMLKEKSALLVLVGIGQGATWATAYAAGIDKSEKANIRLLLINPQQSADISAPNLIELIGDLKLDTFDIYSLPQNSSGIPSHLARKRAANRADMDQYLQITAPSSAWSQAGNNWLFRKVQGLLKNQVLKPLQQKAAEQAAQPKPAKKRNLKPGSNTNNS